mgnify:CR=1 FL=1
MLTGDTTRLYPRPEGHGFTLVHMTPGGVIKENK